MPSVPPVLVIVPAAVLLGVLGVKTMIGVPAMPSPFAPLGTLPVAVGATPSVPPPTLLT